MTNQAMASNSDRDNHQRTGNNINWIRHYYAHPLFCMCDTWCSPHSFPLPLPPSKWPNSETCHCTQTVCWGVYSDKTTCDNINDQHDLYSLFWGAEGGSISATCTESVSFNISHHHPWTNTVLVWMLIVDNNTDRVPFLWTTCVNHFSL